MHVASDVTETVGETPLLALDSFAPDLYGKVEAANPGGSVKDRIAVAMLERAREEGHLEPDATIVEPTSGNTGVGLAVAAAAKGYDLVLTMPESMSEERRKLLRALGAELRLTPTDGDLTARQREVLRTAYAMGYFEYPKGANAGEVADALGISRSTFAEHLAAATGKLFDSLLGPADPVTPAAPRP